MIKFHKFHSQYISRHIHKIYSLNHKENKPISYNCLPSIYPILTFLFNSEATIMAKQVIIKPSSRAIQSLLILPYSETLEVSNTGSTKEISIVFKSFSLNCFVPLIKSGITSDGLIDAQELWHEDFKKLEDQLVTKNISLDKQVDQIVAFLEKQFIDHNKTLGKENYSPQTIFESIKNLPERSFYRKFKDLTYLAPKQFAKIIRIRKALNQAKKDTNTKLTQIAYEQGYFDQAHFNRECQIFANTTPKKIIMHMMDKDSDALWYHD